MSLQPNYHLNSRSANGYYTKGQQIGTSGYPTAPHLHFGGTNSGSYSARWFRNEVNYRWTSNWNYGKDVDSFAVVGWSNNTASLTAYFRDEHGGPYTPGEVRIYHRANGTTTWTDGGLMTPIGDYRYSYSFAGKYSSGTYINWMVRIQRSGLLVYSYAWAQPYYDQPDPNPNNAPGYYAYYINQVN